MKDADLSYSGNINRLPMAPESSRLFCPIRDGRYRYVFNIECDQGREVLRENNDAQDKFCDILVVDRGALGKNACNTKTVPTYTPDKKT